MTNLSITHLSFLGFLPFQVCEALLLSVFIPRIHDAPLLLLRLYLVSLQQLLEFSDTRVVDAVVPENHLLASLRGVPVLRCDGEPV